MTVVKSFPVAIGVIFVLVSAFGVGLAMEPDQNGHMPGCPLMGEQVNICLMNVVEHMAKWQQLFTAIPIILLLLTVALLIVWTRKPDVFSSARTLSPPIRTNEPKINLFNHLVAAFSRGILHPRLYV